jgi:hypothetical protein
MSNLSTLMADIETTAEKVRNLEAELATERAHGTALVEQYRAQSGEALKMLGIAESHKERKPRTHSDILVSAANRKIRQLVKGGEKNPKTLLAAAMEAATTIAKTKLSLAEIPAEIKARIEDRVKTPRAK